MFITLFFRILKPSYYLEYPFKKIYLYKVSYILKTFYKKEYINYNFLLQDIIFLIQNIFHSKLNNYAK